MPCYYPLKAWRSHLPTSSGKYGLIFKPVPGQVPMMVGCGDCIGCRLEYSRQWAVRGVHEASLHEENCFITLTFDDDHLPFNQSLDVVVFQKFMKRLRKAVGPVRFFHCGEYGERFRRPHYHAILFGFDFPDKVLYTIRNSNRIFTSALLSRLWPFGFATVGAVTFESIAYVARYVVKKVNGAHATVRDVTGLSHYEKLDASTGEVFSLKPEYVTMSRNPGIGAGWFGKFQSDVFPHDYVVVRGRKMKPPKYYKRQFELVAPDESFLLTRKRMELAKLRADNATPARLKVREQCLRARISQLKRGLDDEA